MIGTEKNPRKFSFSKFSPGAAGNFTCLGIDFAALLSLVCFPSIEIGFHLMSNEAKGGEKGIPLDAIRFLLQMKFDLSLDSHFSERLLSLGAPTIP